MHVTAAPEDVVGRSPDTSRRRVLVDGVPWTIRLFAATHDRRGGLDLLFESDRVVRRVRDFPPDWFTLPPDVLFALNRRV